MTSIVSGSKAKHTEVKINISFILKLKKIERKNYIKTWFFTSTKNIFLGRYLLSGRPDIRYPAKLLAGYPANSVSGATLNIFHFYPLNLSRESNMQIARNIKKYYTKYKRFFYKMIDNVLIFISKNINESLTKCLTCPSKSARQATWT